MYVTRRRTVVGLLVFLMRVKQGEWEFDRDREDQGRAWTPLSRDHEENDIEMADPYWPVTRGWY